jgi:hypothetical protein
MDALDRAVVRQSRPMDGVDRPAGAVGAVRLDAHGARQRQERA